MANHRPKSLSELNNVYDKAMRAEKAIKESSNLLSTPEPETPARSENVFAQLENKAAEAQKREVFDPDITNIANDFLKRYAQPEKPKAAPREIKRPAPSIQSIYHSPAKEEPAENHDVPLSMGTDFASGVKPQSAPVHKPSHTMPSTEVVKPEVKAPEQEAYIPQPTVIYQAPEVKTETPVSVPAEPVAAKPVKAPEVKAPTTEQAPTVRQTSVKSEPQVAVDHTPRPAPSRVRITSTERSELMEEYMRVMSDEDDEPSYKKPKFSFFKKKKKREDADDTEEQASLYEELPEEEDSAEEIPVVPFDSSEVKYTDEYSDAPAEEEESEQAPMNLYDYIEADFDYDGEDDALDMAFGEIQGTSAEATEEIAAEAAEIIGEESASEEEAAEEAQEVVYEAAEEVAEEITEATDAPEETAEEASEDTQEEVIYPEEAVEEAEETITPEEETFYEEAPTAGMVFEDIFSVSDESKRSHTGGNWSEVLSEQISEEAPAQKKEAPEDEHAEYAEYTENESAVAEDIYSEINEPDETEDESEAEEEDFEAPKKRTFLKILMALAVVICLAGAGLAAFLSLVVDVDSGKLFSEKYRAFSVPEALTSVGLSKGDLVITENIYAHTDEIFVYTNQNDSAYGFGKVTASTSNLVGDYLYVAQTEDGTQLINRDTCLGVVKTVYGGIGSVLSVICDYGIFIAVAFAIFAVALIICLLILISRQRRYEEAAAIYDNPDNFDNDGDEDGNDSPDRGDDDSEYYSDYDTDGIEQGLFVSV